MCYVVFGIVCSLVVLFCFGFFGFFFYDVSVLIVACSSVLKENSSS